MAKRLEPYFRKSLEHHWSMRFKTRHPEGDKYDGVIIHIGAQFIVIREEVDFEFDGMILLPKRMIRAVRDGKFDRCANEILRQNGALARLRVPSWVTKCETIQEFLTTLMQRSLWPGIEMLFEDGSTAYYLGPIETVSDEGFKTKCYDAAGEWENGYWFRWKEIFAVDVDSKYCKHFNQYMQGKMDRNQRTTKVRTKPRPLSKPRSRTT